MKFKKKRLILFFAVSFLFVSLFSFSSPIFSGVKTEASYPLTYRGSNFEDVEYANGTHVWRSMPQAVWNGSHWVEWILNKFDDNYTVQE